ncbi:MAG TPA: diguanylate cyclase [Gemmatimonadales bacterium]
MRERVFLFGDVASRPEGLERALIRAGFALAEAPGPESAAAPDLALVAVRDGGCDLEGALAPFNSPAWAGVPVFVLLPGPERDGISRALALGAVDALAAPVDLGELCARLEARLRIRAEIGRAAGAATLQAELFEAMEEVASAKRPEEMLEILVRRLGEALRVSHCACLVPSSDRRHARLAAVHENPTLRDVAVDLFHYPEAAEASVSGRTVYAAEVLRHGLFLTHLAQWPDSPEVHEIESTAAVPLITHRTVRAVLVLRSRRGEPALTQDQVGQVERLVNATAALLMREDRRAGASRRQADPAVVDRLTGCATLDALDRRIREEMERVRRYGGNLAFAILDVDALRELNARLGSDAGDRYLAELGSILHHEIRGPDFVARYGGDEFALLMPSTDIEGGRRLLGRVAERLDAHVWPDLADARRPRLAAGLVTYPHPGIGRAEDMLALAESALVRGKAGGSDRVGLAA